MANSKSLSSKGVAAKTASTTTNIKNTKPGSSGKNWSEAELMGLNREDLLKMTLVELHTIVCIVEKHILSTWKPKMADHYADLDIKRRTGDTGKFYMKCVELSRIIDRIISKHTTQIGSALGEETKATKRASKNGITIDINPYKDYAKIHDRKINGVEISAMTSDECYALIKKLAKDCRCATISSADLKTKSFDIVALFSRMWHVGVQEWRYEEYFPIGPAGA